MEHFAIGIEVSRFDSYAGQIGHSVAIAATYLLNCVVRAQRRGDGTCHSSNASVFWLEIWFCFCEFWLCFGRNLCKSLFPETSKYAQKN